MKKKIVIILFILGCILFIMPQNISMGANERDAAKAGATTDSRIGDITPDNWVQKAFGSAKSFLEEDTTTDDLGVAGSLLDIFTKLIRALNRILLVALFGISTISLSIIGVKYMTSGGTPHKKEEAKKNLHTLFIGMAYGFGAFIIWRVAMALVGMIIGSLS